MCRVHLIKTKLKRPTGAKEYKMKKSKSLDINDFDDLDMAKKLL